MKHDFIDNEVCPRCLSEKLIHDAYKVTCGNCKAIYEKDGDIIQYVDLRIGTYESTNRIGYNQVAKEFTEKQRRTSKNFHDLTVLLFEKWIEQTPKDMYVVDLGCGTGFITNILMRYFDVRKILALDLSICMLKEFRKMYGNIQTICCSAFSIPLKNNSVSAVISSLCDPFFDIQMLVEVNRILADDGLFIFTVPNKIWERGSRAKKQFSQYVLDDGKIIEVYSFLNDNEQIEDFGKKTGFTLEFAETKFAHELLHLKRNEISDSIFKMATILNLNFQKLPLIDFFVFKKYGI